MRRRHPRRLTTLTLTAALLLSGYATTSTTGQDSTSVTAASSLAASTALFTATQVHTIEVEVEEDVLTQMIQTYLDTGEKEWVTGAVTIDGKTFEDVGIKL